MEVLGAKMSSLSANRRFGATVDANLEAAAPELARSKVFSLVFTLG
jgi:hypothetical protein